ncbi:MAG: transcriptional regulator [Brevibacillus sp.]|nr:transcriptional regulator [Brevibacillus sp.]
MYQMVNPDLIQLVGELQRKMNANLDTYHTVSPGIHRASALLPILISRSHQLSISLLNKHTLSYGLTHVKFSTLLLLFRTREHQLTMTEISQQKHVTRTNITNLVDALEKDHFVERQKDPNDRRSALIHLTQKGIEVILEHLQAYWDRQKWMFDGLASEEQEDLFWLLCRLIAALQEKSSEESPLLEKELVTEQALQVQQMMSSILDSYQEVTPGIHRSSAALSILLARAYNLTIFQLNKHTMDLGLSHAKFSTLLLLFRSKGQNLSMTEISQQKNVTKTNITKLIDGLEQDGFVQRVKDPTDRRSSLVQLTDHAKTFIPAQLQEYWDKQKWVFDGLEEQEQEKLLQLLFPLLANLQLKEKMEE